MSENALHNGAVIDNGKFEKTDISLFFFFFFSYSFTNFASLLLTIVISYYSHFIQLSLKTNVTSY